MFFINPIWYFYLFWLNKLCLSLSLESNHYMYSYPSRVKMMHYLPRQIFGLFSRIKNEFSRHRKPKQPLEQIMCTFFNTRVTLNVEVHWKWSYHEYKSFRFRVWLASCMHFELSTSFSKVFISGILAITFARSGFFEFFFRTLVSKVSDINLNRGLYI